MDLYPTFKTQQELNSAANTAYSDMNTGLMQIHAQIGEDYKKLDGAPSNSWKAFWLSITHPFHNESARYQKCYEDFVYDIQLYNRLILLADIVLYLKGATDSFERNHKPMVDYCNDHIEDSSFFFIDLLLAYKKILYLHRK